MAPNRENRCEIFRLRILWSLISGLLRRVSDGQYRNVCRPGGASPHPDMSGICDGTLRTGSEGLYPQECPLPEMSVDGYWIDPYTVTNEQFARFVAATGYVTLAERPLNPADFHGAPVTRQVQAVISFQRKDSQSNLGRRGDPIKNEEAALCRHLARQ